MNPLDVVRMLVDIILALVPHEQARAVLDDAAIRRQNAIADAAEAAKGLR